MSHAGQTSWAMTSELDEVLALLDETPGAPLDVQQRGTSITPGDDTWDPFVQWGIPDDDDIGDINNVSAPNTQYSGASQTRGTRPQTTKKRKKVNSNRVRDERRFQLLELQTEVAKLEFTFQQLQRIKSSRPNRLSASSSGHWCEDSPGVPKVWQDICSRQVKRRVEAEWENVQLKQQHEREKQLATSVAKLLFKRWRPDDSKSEAERQTRRTDIPAGHIERMSAMVFKELVAGVQACYRNVDRVFRDSNATSAVPHCALLGGDMNARGRERKFFDKRTVPFEMHATGAAWWENWHNYRGQRTQDVSLDELIERFGLEMNDFKANTSATAYCQQVSRRYVEDGRIVFVWDAYVEPYGFKNERVSGVYFLEQMYMLIEPDNEAQDKFSTSVSLCFVTKPHFLDPKLKDDSKTDAVVNFLSSAVISNIISLRDMTETLLLDRALQQCNAN